MSNNSKKKKQNNKTQPHNKKNNTQIQMGPSQPGGSASAKGCLASKMAARPQGRRGVPGSLQGASRPWRGTPVPTTPQMLCLGTRLLQKRRQLVMASTLGKHVVMLHRSPWGQSPFPTGLLRGRLAPTLLPLPAGNGDPDPRAASAPFPQRSSQAETLNPDKPV